jgi:phosphoglycolate phosphatase
MSRFRAAIFDLDGTLIDTRVDLANAVNHARGRLGLDPLSVDEITRYVGDGLTKLLERSFRGRPELVEPARQLFKEHYEAHLVDHSPLYEGVREGVERLAGLNLGMAVLTNKPELFARSIVEHYGLADRFAIVAGPDTYDARKPDPKGALAIARTLGTAPDEMVFVGDNHTDLATAKAAGMQALFCTYGFGRRDGQPYDFSADTFEDVVCIIGGRFR